MKNITLLKEEFSVEMDKRLTSLKRGCQVCNSSINPLKDDIFKTEFYNKVINPAAPIVPPVTDVLIGYFGYLQTKQTLTYDEIEVGESFLYTSQLDVLVQFRTSGLSFIWFAIRSDQSTKDKYIDIGNSNNNGNIGTPDDLMDTPTLITGNISYDFYISNYPTIQITDLLFKNI